MCILNMSYKVTLSIFEFQVVHYFCLKMRVTCDSLGLKILIGWYFCFPWTERDGISIITINSMEVENVKSWRNKGGRTDSLSMIFEVWTISKDFRLDISLRMVCCFKPGVLQLYSMQLSWRLLRKDSYATLNPGN